MSDVIKTISPFIPNDVNTPLDARTRVDTLADIANIQNPFVGCLFYCAENSKFYVVKTLKSATVNGETVVDGAIDTYEEFKVGSTPTIGENGNWVINGEDTGVRAEGYDGATGTTFTPTVSSDGIISWTNNGGLSNPISVSIQGPQGVLNVVVSETEPENPVDGMIWILAAKE